MEFYGILKSTLSDKVSGHRPLPIKKGLEPTAVFGFGKLYCQMDYTHGSHWLWTDMK